MIRLTLPLPPNMANGRAHWRVKDRQRKEYRRAAFVWRIEGGPQPPEQPMAKARIRATLYLHSLMDFDNLMARLKWTVDFLVQDGWIVDDSPKHLEWDGFPAQEIDRKRPRVVLHLEAA